MKFRAPACAALLLISSAAFAAEGANQGAWTEDQLKTLCYSRAGTDGSRAKHFDRCMTRNAGKVGTAKKPGEAAELDKADALLTKKATE